MSNHAPAGDPPTPNRVSKELENALRSNLEGVEQKLGATGRFTHGKLTEEDAGEIAFAITVDKDKLIIDFGYPVKWVGMTKQQANELADLIKRRADEIPD